MRGEFLVGWGSFQEDMKRKAGFRHFIVVDDYTVGGIFDDLQALHEKSESFALLNIMWPQAYGGVIYCKGGVVCPAFEQLPVVFCIEHGKLTGTYLCNATVETATDFVREMLSP